MQPVHIPGLEDQQISVLVPGMFSSARLFVNGQPAPPGLRRGEYFLRRSDGTQVIAQFKSTFLDPVPSLVVDGRAISLAKPLKWYHWVWLFPLVFLFIGGPLGAAAAVVITMYNMQILRSERPAPLRYLLSGAVIFGSLLTFLIIANVLYHSRAR